MYIIYIILKANTEFLDPVQTTLIYSDNYVGSPLCTLPHSGRRCKSQMDTAHAKEDLYTTGEGPKITNLVIYRLHTAPSPSERGGGPLAPSCVIILWNVNSLLLAPGFMPL